VALQENQTGQPTAAELDNTSQETPVKTLEHSLADKMLGSLAAEWYPGNKYRVKNRNEQQEVGLEATVQAIETTGEVKHSEETEPKQGLPKAALLVRVEHPAIILAEIRQQQDCSFNLLENSSDIR
jgi:hypothetical protein